MKTADAAAEVWLKGRHHVYCCDVASEVNGKGHRYFWQVEMLPADLEENKSFITKWKACRTFADGLRLSRRMAEYLERKQREKGRKR